DETAQGCPFPAVVGEVAMGEGEHRETIEETIELFARELGGMLPDAPPAERRANALAAIALMIGGLTLARSLRGRALSDEILRACRAFARRALVGADRVAGRPAPGRRAAAGPARGD